MTALALPPGALNTGTPRCDISVTGMLFVPTRPHDRSPSPGGYFHRMHVVRAHDDRVGSVDRLADRVARAREAMQPVARRSVEREDAVLGHEGVAGAARSGVAKGGSGGPGRKIGASLAQRPLQALRTLTGHASALQFALSPNARMFFSHFTRSVRIMASSSAGLPPIGSEATVPKRLR